MPIRRFMICFLFYINITVLWLKIIIDCRYCHIFNASDIVCLCSLIAKTDGITIVTFLVFTFKFINVTCWFNRYHPLRTCMLIFNQMYFYTILFDMITNFIEQTNIRIRRYILFHRLKNKLISNYFR